METTELLEIIARGEDGKHQFKANVTNQNALASEMVAFANSGGGLLIIGVNDDTAVSGLVREDMARLNQLVSNTASQSVRPAINPSTENVMLEEGLVMVVTIANGMSKPYMDKDGVIWVKSGSDKRKATSREEIQRMYQSAGLLHGDELTVSGMTVADLDLDYFRQFFEKNYGEPIENQTVALPQLLENMNLMREGVLNLSAALLFAKSPYFRLPIFIVKAVCYPGDDIHLDSYSDSQDIKGKLADVFSQSLSFIMGNIRHRQAGQNVNSTGKPEIPREALEELLANALIHRDYFISAPVRIFVFEDRIEIISPGHLPNNLTIANVKSGNSNIRNPILASFATKILPYRGLGNGVRRALKAYPDIDLIDDREGNQFKVIIHRHKDLSTET